MYKKLVFWRVVSACTLLALVFSVAVAYKNNSLDSSASGPFSENALERLFTIDVIEIDPSRGRHGQYFVFDPKKFDTLYGTSGWEGAEFLALNKSTAKLHNIVVWRTNPRDMTTRGFGKKIEDSQAGDWKIGDKLIVLTRAVER